MPVAPVIAFRKAAAPPTSGTFAEVRLRSMVRVGVLDGGSMRSSSVPAMISASRWPAGTTWSLACRSRVIVYGVPGVSGAPVAEEWLPRSAQPRLKIV